MFLKFLSDHQKKSGTDGALLSLSTHSFTLSSQITELYSTRPSGLWHILCPTNNSLASLFRGGVSFYGNSSMCSSRPHSSQASLLASILCPAIVVPWAFAAWLLRDWSYLGAFRRRPPAAIVSPHLVLLLMFSMSNGWPKHLLENDTARALGEAVSQLVPPDKALNWWRW